MLVYGVKPPHFCVYWLTICLSVVRGLIVIIIIIIIISWSMVFSFVWGPLANLFPRPRRDAGTRIASVSIPVRFYYLLVILLTSIVGVFILVRGR